jgi:raffinose/stachyose/melibiose transport system permease protein
MLKKCAFGAAKKALGSIAMVLVGIGFLAPVLWVVSLSLRSKKTVFSALFFTRDFRFDNYLTAWTTFHFGRLFLNSALITAASVAVVLLVASLAAYAFCRLKYRGSEFFFYMILLGMMIPPAAVVIPLFLIMKTLGLYNTHLALILAYIAFGLPIAVLIFRGFFLSVPGDIIEAARIDGSPEVRTFASIIMPLSTPAVATVVIFSFMQNWNEFLLALVLLKDKLLYTLPVGMAQLVGQWDSPWQLIAAGVVIASLPVFLVYLSIQDLYVKGLTAGALKG